MCVGGEGCCILFSPSLARFSPQIQPRTEGYLIDYCNTLYMELPLKSSHVGQNATAQPVGNMQFPYYEALPGTCCAMLQSFAIALTTNHGAWDVKGCMQEIRKGKVPASECNKDQKNP